jgi:attachment invasion locus protein
MDVRLSFTDKRELVMKKRLFAVTLLSGFLVSSCALADDFSGFRVGGGSSSTSVKIEEDIYYYGDDDVIYDGDFGDGFKIEVGYDFNRVVGGALSLETNSDTISYETNDITHGGRIEGSAVKVGIDIGYAIPINPTFLKPYGKIGFVHYSYEESNNGNRYEYDDTSVFLGLGLRFQYSHFYTDLSVDGYILELYDEDYSDWTFVQTAFTVGYKF